jgi:sortase (surface protein transpeptidase)
MAGTAGRHRALRGSWALALGSLIALLLLTAVYVLVFNPIRPSSGSQTQAAVQTVPQSPSSSDNASAPATAAGASPAPASARSQPPAAPPTPGPSCAPTHLSIPELGVDAAVVQIGLDPQGNLGTPTDADKKKAGWYPSALAGAARGTVILTGHTYHDESAIFRTDFDQKVHLGMAVQVSCPDGGRFSYRVTQAKVDLRVEDYSAFIDNGRLYATDGPPQVLIVTCTDWNPIRRDYDRRGVLVASPVS